MKLFIFPKLYHRIMIKTKLSKNGMITLPSKIREQLGIKAGDEIGFVEIEGEFHIRPILKMNELTNPDHFPEMKELIEEMRGDREKER